MHRRVDEIGRQAHELAARLEIPDPVVIPISALNGDNVVDRSPAATFYDGPTLPDYLEQIDVQADRDTDRLPLSIQWVGRSTQGSARPYEAPQAPEVRVATADMSVAQAVEQIIARLRASRPR